MYRKLFISVITRETTKSCTNETVVEDPLNSWEEDYKKNLIETYTMIMKLSINKHYSSCDSARPIRTCDLRSNKKSWKQLSEEAQYETAIMLGAHKLIKY